MPGPTTGSNDRQRKKRCPGRPPLAKLPSVVIFMDVPALAPDEPPVGIVEVDAKQVSDAAQPAGHRVTMQVQRFRRPDDRALLVEVGSESPDRGLAPGRAKPLKRC